MELKVYSEHRAILADKQLQDITIAQLKRLVLPGEYIRYDKEGIAWLKQDDPHWRHGSVSEEVVRVASELDLAVFKVLEALK